jgi:zinc protease
MSLNHPFKIISMKFLSAIFLFIISSSGIFAQINLSSTLPIDPNVKIGKLSNGLTYYIRKNSKPEKKVELRLVINAGSILEDEDQQGLAHFTEHMCFNGTKNFQKNELVSFLQSIGVEFGADLNAYTSFDETVYILPIPLDKQENLEKGFQILEDWASTVSFENSEIDKERGVVLEESRLGKGADDRMSKVTLPKILEGSKYSERLPIGKDSILKTFKYEAIKRFYADWYRPDLMAVIVVGDLETSEAESMVKKHFEKLKNPSSPRSRYLAEIQPRIKSEGLVVTDKEATYNMLQIYYSTQQSSITSTIGQYRDDMIKQLFTIMLSNRFEELKQSANPPFLYGGSNFSEFLRGYESYTSYAILGKDGAETAVNAIIEENERARKFGFTAIELDRTKKILFRNIESAFKEKDKTESSNYTEEYVRSYLNNEPIPGIENEYNYYKNLLEGITIEELNQYAIRVIPTADKNKLVLLTGPDKADFKIPSSDELLSMANKASSIEVKAREEKALATSLMEKTPAPGKITSEKSNPLIGTTTLTLSNGVKVILKPTDFKNDEVLISATRFGGQYLFPDEDRFSAENAATVISKMGVSTFSPLDINKILAGKTVSVNPRIGTISEGIGGSSGKKEIETLLQLVYLYFTQPRRDEDLFNSFVNKQKVTYQNLISDPNFYFQDVFLKTIYNNHPRAPKNPSSDDFAKINLDRAMEIYKSRFGNASGFTFIVTGSFDLNSIKPLLETYLGSLPAAENISSFKDIGVRTVKGVVSKEVLKGKEEKSVVRIVFNGEKPYSESAKLKLQLLAELLNIKATEKLREEMSGVYYAGVYGSFNKNPYNNYTLGFWLPCGPESVEDLIKASFAEIQKIKDNGPSEVDLNKVKETLKKQFEEGIKENSFWLNQLKESVELGSDPDKIPDFKEALDLLSTKDIQNAALEFADMKNYVQIVLYPEAKK